MLDNGPGRYAGPPNSARWYNIADPGQKAEARSLIYLRRREGVKTGAFRTFLTDELVPALVETGALSDLRTQVFMPWIERLWNTPPLTDHRPHRYQRPAGVLRKQRGRVTLGQAARVRFCRPRLRGQRSADVREGRQSPRALLDVVLMSCSVGETWHARRNAESCEHEQASRG